MQAGLNYLEKPKLREPILIAGLPGIAHIGKLAVEYLVHQLRARKFAELYSEHFPEWVIREDGLAKPLKVDFYSCRPDGLERDFILATADAQAASSFGQYKLSGEILDVAVDHGVETVITMAAYVLSSRESRPSVVGTATDAESARMLREHEISLLEDGMIVGMNGLLIGLAVARGLRGFCLLGTTQGGLLDVGATEEVLKALAGVLGFKLDLTDLHTYASIVSKLKPPRLRLPRAVEEEISYIR
jgi:uncharacterized protein (TIGR00162 family)